MAGTSNSGGRNKKSAATHVLHGTFQKCRHADDATPEPPSGKPEPPKSLTGEALAEWTRMVDRLQRSNTLTLVDDAAIYQYAQLHAETDAITADHTRLRKLSASLKKEARRLDGPELLGAITEIVKLEFLLSKHTQQLRQGHLAIRQYLIEFGMTPSARTRVKAIGAVKPASKLDQFRAKHA